MDGSSYDANNFYYSVTVSAVSGSPIYSGSVNVCYYIVGNSLPLTPDLFYSITSGVVNGFASAFLTAADSKEGAQQYIHDNAGDNYRVMDLSGQTLTATQYAFAPMREGGANININNIYACITDLDLSNTIWNNTWVSPNVLSGYNTFGAYGYSSEDERCNFSVLKSLNLSNADFASTMVDLTVGKVTAYRTFSVAQFPNLTNLNLNGTIFAVSNSGKAGA
jgi:hypothetical protein